MLTSLYCYPAVLKSHHRASKMAQWMRVLDTKIDDFSIKPRTHMMERQNQPRKLSSDLNICTMTYV